MGDNCLILSQRLCGWTGHGPTLEDDLALSNVALDLLGQARLWLDYASSLHPTKRSEDALAYWRDAHEFRNLLLLEQPNGNFADTQVRQFFFDSWHFLVLTALSNSTDEKVAAISTKALKEVDYHVRRSSHWMLRLGGGTELSRSKLILALEQHWNYVGELFEMDELEQEMHACGIGCDLGALHAEWLAYVNDVLGKVELALPSRTPFQSGGKRGKHGEHLLSMLMEMQYLQRVHPGAQW
ncbi:1,2-phenylacetyl-CoA epoxidase subunit PaaC [Solimicrobium silvestre]|nr:1,2-phenylacetyl-CoA epoxidase subunit PaaC [Solimicrobium silvestre]